MLHGVGGYRGVVVGVWHIGCRRVRATGWRYHLMIEMVDAASLSTVLARGLEIATIVVASRLSKKVQTCQT